MNFNDLMTLSEEKINLMEEQNKLISQQEKLRVHYYRTDKTELTDDDRKFDELQVKIDELDERIYG